MSPAPTADTRPSKPDPGARASSGAVSHSTERGPRSRTVARHGGGIPPLSSGGGAGRRRTVAGRRRPSPRIPRLPRQHVRVPRVEIPRHDLGRPSAAPTARPWLATRPGAPSPPHPVASTPTRDSPCPPGPTAVDDRQLGVRAAIAPRPARAIHPPQLDARRRHRGQAPTLIGLDATDGAAVEQHPHPYARAGSSGQQLGQLGLVEAVGQQIDRAPCAAPPSRQEGRQAIRADGQLEARALGGATRESGAARGPSQAGGCAARATGRSRPKPNRRARFVSDSSPAGPSLRKST